MRHGDALGGLVATSQQHPFAVMLHPLADDFGAAKPQTRAETRVHLISAVCQYQLQLLQYPHRLVRMAIYPAIGVVEVDRANVKRWQAYALRQVHGILTHCGRPARRLVIFAEALSSKL